MATYIGFSTNPKFKNFKATDFDLAVEDLLNHFNIRIGEKLMNPTFGCVVWDVLFENFTDDVRAEIIENIGQIIDSEPRLNLVSINVDEYDQGLQIDLELQYVNSPLATSLSVFFDQNSDQIYVAG
jgi:phage baseplate assembly protein W